MKNLNDQIPSALETEFREFVSRFICSTNAGRTISYISNNLNLEESLQVDDINRFQSLVSYLFVDFMMGNPVYINSQSLRWFLEDKKDNRPPKLLPLKQWICDKCGKLINTIDDGDIEWLCVNEMNFGFRIVHHNKSLSSTNSSETICYYYKDNLNKKIYL